MDYCQELFLSLTKVQAYILEIDSCGEEIPLIVYLNKELYFEVIGDIFKSTDYTRCNFLLESIRLLKKSLKKNVENVPVKQFIDEYRNLRRLISINTIKELQPELDGLSLFLDELDDIIRSL